MSFSADISKFAKKISASLDQTSRAITISLFNGVIRDTRVDTGRLRGNWQTSVGKPIVSIVDRLDPTGNKAESDVKKNVKGASINYLTNNLKYAQHWEEQDGMIAKNMQRINRIIKENT